MKKTIRKIMYSLIGKTSLEKKIDESKSTEIKVSAPEPSKTYSELLDIYKTQTSEIKKSGCGCSRFGARDFIDRRSKSAESILAAYIAADSKLHSICGRDSGFTRSNSPTVSKAIKSAVELIDKLSTKDIEKIISTLPAIIPAVKEETYLLKDDLLQQKIVETAEKLHKSKRSYLAAKLISSAAHLDTSKDEQKREFFEIAKKTASKYAKSALSEICKQDLPYEEKGRKLGEMSRMISYLDKSNPYSKSIERIISLNSKQDASEDLISSVTRAYSDKIYEKRELSNEISSQMESKISSIEQLAQREHDTIDVSIDKHKRALQYGGTFAQIAEKEIAILQDRKVKSVSLYDEQIQTVKKEYEPTITAHEKSISDLLQSRDETIDKIKKRTMSKAEYHTTQKYIRQSLK